MTLHTHTDVMQGSGEWLDLRRGMLTASTIGKLITPTLKIADNDTSRGLTATLVAERITGVTEDVYVSADMDRGTFDEPIARAHYSEHIAPVTECGFMVWEAIGCQLGYSPDGLVGDDGLIEIKSRRPKTQIQTIITDTVPTDNMAQLQCGLFVSGRKWVDYVSWCGGLPMWVIRVHPDPAWFDAISSAASTFEANATRITDTFQTATAGLPATARVEPYEEMRL